MNTTYFGFIGHVSKEHREPMDTIAQIEMWGIVLSVRLNRSSKHPW